MKLAVFSDVQGNLPALEAVLEDIQSWGPDLVILNGDLVSRGPNSRGCLELFQSLRQAGGGWPVKGNHEDYVLHCQAQPPEGALDAAMRQFADWTVAQLGERLNWLRNWPDQICLEGPEQSWVQVTHGSLAGNRIGISASLPDATLAERVPEDVALFVVAHTHRPMERWFRGVRILNVGSVGAPFDGDPRASYARIEHHGGQWHCQIRRLEYDRARAEREFRDSGFLDQAGPLASFIFQEWRRARLMMPLLRERYLGPLSAGELDLEQAVAEFLENL